jgi:hypothetical protein
MEVFIANDHRSKAEGSNADARKPGLARAGRGGLVPQSEAGNYWDPAQRHAKPAGEETEQEDEDMDEENQRRIMGEYDTGPDLPLPIVLEELVDEQRKRRTSTLKRTAAGRGMKRPASKGRDFRETP